MTGVGQSSIAALVARHAGRLEHFASDLLRIEPEEGGGVIPLVFNQPQEWFRYAFWGIPRCIALKGRGMGITTVGVADGLHRTWARPHHHGVLVAQTDKDTRKIFERAILMDTHLPKGMALDRPSENAREVRYSAMESWLMIATAGAQAPLRGPRVHFLWMTEAAYYPGDTRTQGQMIAGLLGATRRGDAYVESTAKGSGNWFHDTYMAARAWASARGFTGLFSGLGPTDAELDAVRRDPDVRAGTQWVPLFMPWWWDDRNQLVLDAEQRRTFVMSDDERRWAEPARVPIEQVAWRRAIRRQYIPASLVDQEYPCSDLESFLVSGDSFFDLAIIQALAAQCPPPARKLHGGQTWIWEDPKPSLEYVLSGDPCDGTPTGDFAYLSMHERRTSRQVARFHGRVVPAELARIAAQLGRLYYEALIAGENNMAEFVRRLRDDQGYGRQIHQEDPLRPGELSDRPGIRTTAANRQAMLDALKAAVEGVAGDPPTMLMRCPVFFQECATFKRNRTGKFEHESGAHDDSVLTAAFAVEALGTSVAGFALG